MAQYVLTSYVGKQIFGVFNTILAVCANPHWRSLVDSIVLYSTKDSQGSRGVSKGTLEESERIKSYCEQHGYPPVKIVEFDRTENLAAEFVKDATSDGKKVLFNIEGGMNYCVAQYMSELVKSSLDHSVIISDGSVYRTVSLNSAFENRNWDTEKLVIPELSVEEIFDIQNVEYEISNEKTSFGKYVVGNIEKNRLPKTLLHNVTVNNLDFDLVWNCGGNHLAFLVSPGSRDNISRKNDKILSRVRNVIQWAADKTVLKQIYDCKCYILCEKRAHKETVKIQGRGKAIPLNICGYVQDNKFIGGKDNAFSKIACVELDKILSNKSEPELGKLENDENFVSKVDVTEDTLITTYGKDPAATLATIFSHLKNHPYLKTVILLCTLELVSSCNRLLASFETYHVNLLKHVNFRIVKTDLKGRTIPYRLSVNPNIKNIEVNATPGTKGQTAFLTMFAQKNNFPIWTLNRETASCCNQQIENFTVEQGINPVSFLSLDRYKVTSNPISKDKTKTMLLKHVLDVMSWSGSDSCKNNFGEVLKAAGITVETQSDGSFNVSSDDRSYQSVKLGSFFEDLVNVSFSNLRGAVGNSNVSVIDPRTLEGHIEEIDYLFAYKYMIVEVSCKAYYQKDATHLHKKLATTVKESVAFAKSICRFCHPVMCFINKFDVPDIYVDKSRSDPVGIIDCWDLCDPDRLQDILERLDASINVEGAISAEDDSELTVEM